MMTTTVVELDELEWKVLLALKEELAPDEVVGAPWDRRAAKAGVTLEEFFRVAEPAVLVLGTEHPDYKNLIQSIGSVAQKIGDQGRIQKYSQLLQAIQ